jgi:hypothetical protein
MLRWLPPQTLESKLHSSNGVDGIEGGCGYGQHFICFFPRKQNQKSKPQSQPPAREDYRMQAYFIQHKNLNPFNFMDNLSRMT